MAAAAAGIYFRPFLKSPAFRYIRAQINVLVLDLAKKELKYIPGVGPSRAELLKKELHVFNQEELLYVFPYKYMDRSTFYRIADLTSDLMYVQLKGQFVSFEEVGVGRKRRLIGRLTDGSGVIELVWFKGLKYITGKYRVGEWYVVFGKLTSFAGQLSMVHPDMERMNEGQEKWTPGLQPFYITTEAMKTHFIPSKVLHTLITNLIYSLTERIPDTLPDWIIRQYRLMPLHHALVQMHLPTNQQLLKQARYRLAFEELFYLQLHILRYTKEREKRFKGHPFLRVGELFNTFYYHYLPYELTEAQKRVIREIRADLAKPRQMNRLLQGDVGSGKTLVALMCLLLAADNGYQSTIMAPTEILAVQHEQTIRSLLKDMPVRVGLLTGSTKPKERRKMHEALQSGDLHILIGTHALIEDTVRFKNLGLAVIDEQHRFGVEQRSRLWTKNEIPPHILVMTATPIPRTLAMTIYGDLDVSVIDELPPGRKPVITLHQYEAKKSAIYRFMNEQLVAGHQIYVVYPLIQESESLDFKNLEEGYQQLLEAFPDVPIGMVHGQMRPAEKDSQMQAFVSGQTKILVATTVIEVGVNVPNASVMVIESAERFGLSQLHQLRGRVGRGADQSYCLLVTSHKLSEESRRRIEIMTTTNDGFEIAEADLKMRGPGDLEGLQQSGMPFELKVANLARDVQLTEYVRNLARSILDADPDLTEARNGLLKEQLLKRFDGKINWGVIS
jgi:ATP-dependent DNA helicase RecG